MAPNDKPGTAVDREARRLVEHEKARVLVHDRGLHGREQPVRKALRRRVRRRGLPHGRQPHFVVGCQAVVRLLALAVDADLAAAQQPVDPAPRYPGQLAQQEIVESLSLGSDASPHPSHANRLISIRRHGESLTY